MTEIPPEYINQIVTGDARELAKRLPDESVDLILCDPVYWNHSDYQWVARVATRILKPGGNLIMQCGNPDLPIVLIESALSGLMYQRVLCERFPIATQAYRESKCFVGWKPYVWFSRGERSGGWVFDAMNGGGSLKTDHEWQDSIKFFVELINRITANGGIIADFFTGSGTVPAVCKMLSRNYIAFEIDPDTAERARERVRNTQPPLFVLQPEQAVMELAE